MTEFVLCCADRFEQYRDTFDPVADVVVVEGLSDVALLIMSSRNMASAVEMKAAMDSRKLFQRQMYEALEAKESDLLVPSGEYVIEKSSVADEVKEDTSVSLKQLVEKSVKSDASVMEFDGSKSTVGGVKSDDGKERRRRRRAKREGDADAEFEDDEEDDSDSDDDYDDDDDDDDDDEYDDEIDEDDGEGRRARKKLSKKQRRRRRAKRDAETKKTKEKEKVGMKGPAAATVAVRRRFRKIKASVKLVPCTVVYFGTADYDNTLQPT